MPSSPACQAFFVAATEYTLSGNRGAVPERSRRDLRRLHIQNVRQPAAVVHLLQANIIVHPDAEAAHRRVGKALQGDYPIRGHAYGCARYAGMERNAMPAYRPTLCLHEGKQYASMPFGMMEA